MKSEPVNTRIPKDLLNRARNAVYFTPGLTQTKLVIDGLKKEVHRLEKKNRGKFPQRQERITRGRPL